MNIIFIKDYSIIFYCWVIIAVTISICIYKNARRLMDKKLGQSNSVSDNIDISDGLADGRARYASNLRIKMYGCIIKAAREARPELPLALCLEEKKAWKELGIVERIGKCNCVL